MWVWVYGCVGVGVWECGSGVCGCVGVGEAVGGLTQRFPREGGDIVGRGNTGLVVQQERIYPGRGRGRQLAEGGALSSCLQ